MSAEFDRVDIFDATLRLASLIQKIGAATGIHLDRSDTDVAIDRLTCLLGLDNETESRLDALRRFRLKIFGNEIGRAHV